MYPEQLQTQIELTKVSISDLQNKLQLRPDNISNQAKLNLMKMRLRYILQTEEQHHQMREVF